MSESSGDQEPKYTKHENRLSGKDLRERRIEKMRRQREVGETRMARKIGKELFAQIQREGSTEKIIKQTSTGEPSPSPVSHEEIPVTASVFPGAEPHIDKVLKIDSIAEGEDNVQAEQDFQALKERLRDLTQPYYDKFVTTARNADSMPVGRLDRKGNPQGSQSLAEWSVVKDIRYRQNVSFDSYLYFEKEGLSEPRPNYYELSVKERPQENRDTAEIRVAFKDGKISELEAREAGEGTSFLRDIRNQVGKQQYLGSGFNPGPFIPSMDNPFWHAVNPRLKIELEGIPKIHVSCDKFNTFGAGDRTKNVSFEYNVKTRDFRRTLTEKELLKRNREYLESDIIKVPEAIGIMQSVLSVIPAK